MAQILICPATFEAVENLVEAETVGLVQMKCRKAPKEPHHIVAILQEGASTSA